MQEYFHQADVSMRRHGWTEEEEAEEAKPCGQDCSCLLLLRVRSEASHLSAQCCKRTSHWLTLLRQTSSRNVDKEQVEVSVHGEQE